MNALKSQKRAAGFSLLELMVVIVVFLIVLTAVFTLMQTSLRSSATTYETSDAQQALRFAHEALSRDLYSAGDGLIGINDVRAPVGFVRNYLSSQTAAALDPDGDGFTRLPLVLSDDNLPANTALISAPSGFALTGSDRLSMLQEDAAFTPIALPVGGVSANGATITMLAVDAARFGVGEIYYLTDGATAAFGCVTSTTATTVEFAAGDVYGLNQPNATGGFFSKVSANGAVATTLKRMRLTHYFLTDTNLLARRAFGVAGRGHTDAVIAEHIAALNFRYIIDLSDAGGALRQPVTQLSTAQEQNAARQVEANIAAETAKPLQHNNQRATFTAAQQIALRNLQFREAQQPVSGVIE
jgi:prepilin-type N-terminal cleavage/methylation domain-containing protein